jgi:hypothetical protein
MEYEKLWYGIVAVFHGTGAEGLPCGFSIKS